MQQGKERDINPIAYLNNPLMGLPWVYKSPIKFQEIFYKENFSSFWCLSL